MENNGLLGGILLSLGFDVYGVGARVFEGGGWTGWSHRCNLVTIAGIKYHVDVGFGSAEGVRPMGLPGVGESRDIIGPAETNIAPAQMRLHYRRINAPGWKGRPEAVGV